VLQCSLRFLQLSSSCMQCLTWYGAQKQQHVNAARAIAVVQDCVVQDCVVQDCVVQDCVVQDCVCLTQGGIGTSASRVGVVTCHGS
jgi:hypothetical protein